MRRVKDYCHEKRLFDSKTTDIILVFRDEALDNLFGEGVLRVSDIMN